MRNPGRFGWVRRMGEHEAFHRSRVNRIIHWICIPIEIWSVIQLLTALSPTISLALILLLIPVYIATDLFAGILMSVILAAFWSASNILAGVVPSAGILAAILFTVAFWIQTGIGHKKFEKLGRDDTEGNISEFRRTLNPIPLILLFYYHLVEILFALGYRPKLRRRVEYFRDQFELSGFEAQSLESSPRL